MQKTMMSESLNMGMTTMSAASKNGWHKKKKTGAPFAIILNWLLESAVHISRNGCLNSHQ